MNPVVLTENVFARHVTRCKICQRVLEQRETIDAPIEGLCNAGFEALEAACEARVEVDPTLN